jgi:hypothetical protein
MSTERTPEQVLNDLKHIEICRAYAKTMGLRRAEYSEILKSFLVAIRETISLKWTRTAPHFRAFHMKSQKITGGLSTVKYQKGRCILTYSYNLADAAD